MGNNGSLTRNEKIKKLATRVDELVVSRRTQRCFKTRNISTLFDLCETTEAEIRKTGGFGLKTLNEIKEVLQENFGLTLGMRFDEKMKAQVNEYLVMGRLPEVPADPDSEATADASVSDPPAAKPVKLSVQLAEFGNAAQKKARKLEENVEQLFSLRTALLAGLVVTATEQTPEFLKRFLQSGEGDLTPEKILSTIDVLREKIAVLGSIHWHRGGGPLQKVIAAAELLEED